MASFIGTNKEFRRFVGPRLRNLVQQITKKQKATIGACEHCGDAGELEAAHLTGRDRNQIIDQLLDRRTKKGVVTIDLFEFESEFKSEHYPIEKSILILCVSCHRKYDEKLKRSPASKTGNLNRDLLPISLEPTNTNLFKSKLLKFRVAEIEIHYSDGRTETMTWNAARFSASSNVFGNLRSRPEFRAGKWQSKGITHVHVRIQTP